VKLHAKTLDFPAKRRNLLGKLFRSSLRERSQRFYPLGIALALPLDVVLREHL